MQACNYGLDACGLPKKAIWSCLPGSCDGAYHCLVKILADQQYELDDRNCVSSDAWLGGV